MKNELDLENDAVTYDVPMLPGVDYDYITDVTFSFSITDLEVGVHENCQYFLEALKSALLEEKIVQSSELLIAHLCAYLGSMMAIHTVHEAEKLVPLTKIIIEHQARCSYDVFNRYPINSSIKKHAAKKKNLDKLRQITPGSILAQTMRLGHYMWDMLEELKNNYPMSYLDQTNQKNLFCPEETLIKITLYLSGIFCAKWREQLDGLSDNYVINQLAIQIGWLIGYFSHLSREPIEELRYLEYGLPVVDMYREVTFNLMKSFAEAKHAKEAEEEHVKIETLLKTVHTLAERTHQQAGFPLNDFQKHFFMAKMEIENELMRLLSQGSAIKIVLMSVFYFWFDLVLSCFGNGNDKDINQEETFSHMFCIIDLVKNIVHEKPIPKLSREITELNKKMQELKEYMPDPESLNAVSKETAEEQTEEVNTVIFKAIEKCIQKDIHPEAIANALFSHWLRLSVFFGVSESDWQKMDHYFVDILKEVDEYVTKLKA